MAIERVDELRTFVRVVESRSLTGAARILGLTKNGVSRRLLRLEARLGVTLFDRNTRRVHATEDGLAFYRRCTEIVALLEAAEESISKPPNRLRGTVRVAIPGQFAAPLAGCLAGFLEQHPGLNVLLQVSDRPVNVVSAGIDLAVVAGAVEETSLVARRIGEAMGVLAATKTYLTRRGRPRRLADLAEHDCLLYVGDRPQTHWTLVDDEGKEVVTPVRGRIASTSSVCLRDALIAGLGIGVIMRADLDSRLGIERVLPDTGFKPFRSGQFTRLRSGTRSDTAKSYGCWRRLRGISAEGHASRVGVTISGPGRL